MNGPGTGRSSPVGVLLWPVFLASLGLTFVEFGLPIYGKSLGASALAIGAMYSVFTISTLATRPLVGLALDRRGRRPLLLAGLACMALAMGVFASAETVGSLYVASAVQGLAAALLWTSVNTIVADLSPTGELGRAMGRIDETSAQSQIAGMFVALLVSLSLPDELTWPVVFATFVVMAVVGTGVAYRRVPESRPAKPGAFP